MSDKIRKMFVVPSDWKTLAVDCRNMTFAAMQAPDEKTPSLAVYQFNKKGDVVAEKHTRRKFPADTFDKLREFKKKRADDFDDVREAMKWAVEMLAK